MNGMYIPDTKRIFLLTPDIIDDDTQLWLDRTKHHYIANNITKDQFDKITTYITNESTRNIGIELLNKLTYEGTKIL